MWSMRTIARLLFTFGVSVHRPALEKKNQKSKAPEFFDAAQETESFVGSHEAENDNCHRSRNRKMDRMVTSQGCSVFQCSCKIIGIH